MAESLITTPDPGMELCYECDGKCVCWHCRGTTQINERYCAACGGSGKCIVCNGDGQVPIGTDARAKVASSQRVLVRVGFFRELGFDGMWTIEGTRGQRSPEHLAEVLSYLRGGKVFIASPGYARDVFDGTTVAGTYSTRTDGMFAWPDTLAHYVARYAVALPRIFESHMVGLNWIPPTDIDLNGLVLSSP